MDTSSTIQSSGLTGTQYLLWLGQKLNPDIPLYNMILTFRWKVRIDEARFGQAWQRLVEQNEALRSVIREENGQPTQEVLAAMPESLQIVDLSARPADLASWIDAQRQRIFDVERCLYHSALIRLGEDDYLWYLNQHHLFTDGWSSSVVYRRQLEFYEGTITETSLPPQYGDYISFEQAKRRGAAQTAQQFWDKKLARHHTSPISLYGRPTGNLSPRTTRVARELGTDLTERLKALSSQNGFLTLTPNLAMFQIFATTLFAWVHRASGIDKLAIGAPSHNRPSKSFKETIGVFIEIFPMLAEFDEEETFMSLFKKVLSETSTFLRHAQPGAGKPEYIRAFPVFLNFIHASFPNLEGEPVDVDWIHSGYGDSDHALRLQVHDFTKSGNLCLHFDFNDELFPDDLKAWASEHFVHLLEAFTQNPDAKISDVFLLGREEQQALLKNYNTTKARRPDASVSVVMLFQREAAAHPDTVAIREGGAIMTYAELNASVDRVASDLRERGIGRGDKVGLCLLRSTQAVISLLGVLRAGAAYVPLDPAYPADRLRFILEDIEAPLLITEARLQDRLPLTKTPAILVDDALQSTAPSNLLGDPQSEDIAYLIYTSGSTGQPKGVLVDHGGLSHYATWSQDTYLDEESLAFPLFSSLAFDLTITSIFVPLISGGEIVIYPEGDGAVDLAVLQVFEDDAVDIVKLTPSHLALFKDIAPGDRRIRKMILGGEDLRTDLAKEITSRFTSGLEIYNEYGPTEAVVGCMIHRYDPELNQASSVPIGKPADGVQIYLLDPNQQPVPNGVAGEMYIAGDRLARGYWNRPELTAERFVSVPELCEGQLYRTGDLARMQDPQTMTYLGRIDDQVKVRGVRIELGEIESQMQGHPQVGAAVVDLIQFDDPTASQDSLFHCIRCGLPSNFPEVDYDDDGVCHLCREYATYEHHVSQYFQDLTALNAILEKGRTRKQGEYDCMTLLSGGKDSTYVVYQLVKMGFKVLAFTLDNGYISDGAKANVRKVVDELGIDHIFGETPAMNAIFVDSLKRFSNVCQGCFKALYTLSMQVALEKGIPTIVTGLSRGQFFETRLTAESFCQPQFDVSAIDETVLDARKAYHRMDDVVARTMDTGAFQNDDVFQQVEFVDFYRYSQVSLDDMYAFLENDAPWIRPDDTGRSTNCLINEAGIYVHKKERGHHNYALPYSWDVRLGHKEREAAMDELDDQINVQNVHRILKEIGYETDLTTYEQGDKRLAGYYVSDKKLTTEDWHAFLGDQLPDYLIPSYFVQLPKLPLTVNGKVDRALLPPPVERRRPELHQVYTAPVTELEMALAEIWADVLKVERVGLDDNFFDLGGDSIMNIQIVARCAQANIALTANQLFKNQTVRDLAHVADWKTTTSLTEEAVVHQAPFTPIQNWFFRQAGHSNFWNHELVLQATTSLDTDRLKKALVALTARHLSLTTSFTNEYQQLTEHRSSPELLQVQLAGPSELATACAPVHESFNIAEGKLFAAVLASFQDGNADCLVLIAHHLAVDGISWQVLTTDLEAAYAGTLDEVTTSASYLQWASHLGSVTFEKEIPFWKGLLAQPSGALPVPTTPTVIGVIAQHHEQLAAAETDILLHKTPQAYHTQIQDALLTALCLSLSEAYDSPHWTIDVEGHGRQHPLDDAPSIHATVGWFTTIYPVRLEAMGNNAISTLTKTKEFLRSIPNQGFGFGSLRETQEGLRDAPARQILFNYLGQLDAALSTNTFAYHKPLSLRRDPSLKAPYLLEINAFTHGGQLNVALDFAPDTLSADTAASLSNKFLAKLCEINQACAANDQSAFTPSDFPLANLDTDKLGKVAALLKKPNGGS